MPFSLQKEFLSCEESALSWFAECNNNKIERILKRKSVKKAKELCFYFWFKYINCMNAIQFDKRNALVGGKIKQHESETARMKKKKVKQ